MRSSILVNMCVSIIMIVFLKPMTMGMPVYSSTSSIAINVGMHLVAINRIRSMSIASSKAISVVIHTSIILISVSPSVAVSVVVDLLFIRRS